MVKIGGASLEDVSPYFHLPIEEAARELGVCSSALKRRCRRLGIKRWPFRKVRSMSNSLSRTMEGMASVGVGPATVVPAEYLQSAQATRLAAQAAAASLIRADQTRRPLTRPPTRPFPTPAAPAATVAAAAASAPSSQQPGSPSGTKPAHPGAAPPALSSAPRSSPLGRGPSLVLPTISSRRKPLLSHSAPLLSPPATLPLHATPRPKQEAGAHTADAPLLPSSAPLGPPASASADGSGGRISRFNPRRRVQPSVALSEPLAPPDSAPPFIAGSSSLPPVERSWEAETRPQPGLHLPGSSSPAAAAPTPLLSAAVAAAATAGGGPAPTRHPFPSPGIHDPVPSLPPSALGLPPPSTWHSAEGPPLSAGSAPPSQREEASHGTEHNVQSFRCSVLQRSPSSLLPPSGWGAPPSSVPPAAPPSAPGGPPAAPCLPAWEEAALRQLLSFEVLPPAEDASPGSSSPQEPICPAGPASVGPSPNGAYPGPEPVDHAAAWEASRRWHTSTSLQNGGSSSAACGEQDGGSLPACVPASAQQHLPAWPPPSAVQQGQWPALHLPQGLAQMTALQREASWGPSSPRGLSDTFYATPPPSQPQHSAFQSAPVLGASEPFGNGTCNTTTSEAGGEGLEPRLTASTPHHFLPSDPACVAPPGACDRCAVTDAASSPARDPPLQQGSECLAAHHHNGCGGDRGDAGPCWLPDQSHLWTGGAALDERQAQATASQGEAMLWSDDAPATVHNAAAGGATPCGGSPAGECFQGPLSAFLNSPLLITGHLFPEGPPHGHPGPAGSAGPAPHCTALQGLQHSSGADPPASSSAGMMAASAEVSPETSAFLRSLGMWGSPAGSPAAQQQQQMAAGLSPLQLTAMEEFDVLTDMAVDRD